jgi:hypothetical protein
MVKLTLCLHGNIWYNILASVTIVDLPNCEICDEYSGGMVIEHLFETYADVAYLQMGRHCLTCC